jgi:hypothetical protein
MWKAYWAHDLDAASTIYILLVTFRFLIWIGLGYRFFVHRRELAQTPYWFHTYNLVIALWAANLAYLVLVLIISGRMRHSSKGLMDSNPGWIPYGTPLLPSALVWTQIICDTLFYALFYALTMNHQSD